MGRPKIWYKFKCENCGYKFQLDGSHKRRKSHIFCSNRCAMLWRGKYKPESFVGNPPHKSGEEHPRWKGGGLTSQGYKTFQKNKIRYIEHRYIMEKHLGRKISSLEHIHHINGNKIDNRIENLELISNSSEHTKKYHNKFIANQYIDTRL